MNSGQLRADAPRSRLDFPFRDFALTLLYVLAWLLLLRASSGLWYLPAGLRLGALWLVPSRRWGWLAAGEWSALAIQAAAGDWPLLSPTFLGMSVLPWLIYAGIVRLLRGPEAGARLDDPRQMLLLLAGGIAAAAVVSPVLQSFMYLPGSIPADVAGIFAFIYGDILGQLMVAPLMVLAWQTGRLTLRSGPLWTDVLVLLLLSLTVIWLIGQRADLAPYLLVIAFAPIFLVAFRRGWEGAAISVAVVGLLIEATRRAGMLPVDVRALQLALTVVGGGGLVLGAACSELRRSNERLAQHHRDLREANRSLMEAASELRLVSQRLVRLEEQGQRELAAELEYEIGRSIHALSTRISLAFRDIRDEHMLRLLESVREQVREMQESLRRVLRQLRPQALDTHGLREAIGFGPLRDMAEEAGITYEAAFHGEVEALRDDAQTTVYRISQAAVREASRSQSVRRVLVRLEVAPGTTDSFEVLLQVDIETSPFGGAPFDAQALPAITDRVVAQQGSYTVEVLSPGVRHLVRFQEAPATPA